MSELKKARKVLVTGAAGFIGAFLCKRLLNDTDDVILGIDNMNAYYDVGIKESRLNMLENVRGESNRFDFIKCDLSDGMVVERLFTQHEPDVVVHLAAQAGVRYSIENPRTYIDSNIIAFFNILEACRHHTVDHLIYASSSSIYGANTKVPYSVEDKVDNPVSLYAATKKSNELMAHAYSKLYDIPTTGLRFFTVYGPMGRPDMAYFKFADQIAAGKPIDVYNKGDMKRDFTYIDDVTFGIVKVMNRVPQDSSTGIPYKIYNIGNRHPESLAFFIETLERFLIEEDVVEKPSEHRLLPMQPGDVYQTYADMTDFEHDFSFRPSSSLEYGLREFVQWYKKYRAAKGVSNASI